MQWQKARFSHAAKGTVFLHTFAAFNCIMNHSTSKTLHILDAFLDFFLLLGAYEVSSLLRMHSPWGEAFWWVDVARFRRWHLYTQRQSF